MRHISEEFAKTKWCPFKRVGVLVGNGGVGINFSAPMVGGNPGAREPYDVTEETRCEGSGCMMWVEVASAVKAGEIGHSINSCGMQIREEKDQPAYGYCGLARNK